MQLGIDYCYSCEMDEPIAPGTPVYIICGECSHVYLTPEELVDTFNSEIARANCSIDPLSQIEYHQTADKINFCPLCLHDF